MEVFPKGAVSRRGHIAPAIGGHVALAGLRVIFRMPVPDVGFPQLPGPSHSKGTRTAVFPVLRSEGQSTTADLKNASGPHEPRRRG